MKHFVAISLVFFSLTQLAKLERAEAYKLLHEGYCQQQLTAHKAGQKTSSLKSEQGDHFLSSNELSLNGMLPVLERFTYTGTAHQLVDFIVIAGPNNNSPPLSAHL